MDTSPIFWNTQGKIKYDIEKNYFNYETSMSVNWENKLARRVLITIMKLFNRPEILNVQKNGIAIWTKSNMKNTIFYRLPTIFNEIILRDEYVHNENGVYLSKYPFMTVSYKIKLEKKYIKSLNEFHNYINYDSIKRIINVKSRTLEENIVILNIFLDQNNLTKNNIPLILKKKMEELNEKTEKEFVNSLKSYISNINGKMDIIILPEGNSSNEIIEEEKIEEEDKRILNLE